MKTKMFVHKPSHVIIVLFALIAHVAPVFSQPANLVNNGGFEDYDPNLPKDKPYYWSGLDSTKYFGLLMAPPYRVPKSSYGFQYPKSGKCYFGFSFFINYSWVNRGYPRNFLKQKLKQGSTYCVNFYVAPTNNSTHGVDAIGAYFGDESLDTIKNSLFPLTFLSPQISNPTNHVITDTLNWTLITGTFVATGNEKYMVLGNFKSNANTNMVLTNPAQLPTISSEYFIDDVSVIDLDLPAFAGNDRSFIPGDSVYLGRESDVGIDEACVWYKLPGNTPIDTVAGLWVKPITTSTYVVVQTICGNVKRDTVTLLIDGVGLNSLPAINAQLKIYPQPTRHELTLHTDDVDALLQFNQYTLVDQLGRNLFTDAFVPQRGRNTIVLPELPAGIYYLQLQSNEGVVVKKVVVE